MYRDMCLCLYVHVWGWVRSVLASVFVMFAFLLHTYFMFKSAIYSNIVHSRYRKLSTVFVCFFLQSAFEHWVRKLRVSFVVVGWLLACLTSQQQASVSQGRICSDNFTCCHTEIEVADQTFYLTQSQYTDTGLTSPSADPIMPGAWQGSHWSAIF